jgi:hypothetical protein
MIQELAGVTASAGSEISGRIEGSPKKTMIQKH